MLYGESKEAIELVKKHLAHGHELNRERFTKEFVDKQEFRGEINSHSHKFTSQEMNMHG